MSDDIIDQSTFLVELTSQVVSAYVSNNPVAAHDLPGLISSIHQSFAGLDRAGAEAEEPAPEPAVPVKKSITPDYLICLEDGKKLKMLKRHLASAYGMTPEEYRQKWGLAANYPMVAPNYAKQRSELARSIGLGRKKAA